MVVGFGITTKTISSLKKADGLVVGSQLCKEITKCLKRRQNPVTKLNKMVSNLKRRIIWIGSKELHQELNLYCLPLKKEWQKERRVFGQTVLVANSL